MYSVSKTFVSTAIGLLVDEGRISLDDRICDYFKDQLPANPHPYLLNTRIRDLLMMASPYTTNTYHRYAKDWTWTFFNTEPSHPSGTISQLNTSATFILDVLVERLYRQAVSRIYEGQDAKRVRVQRICLVH